MAKTAKKMGTNPLSGLNGLIRSTQDTPDAPSTPANVRETLEPQGAHDAQSAQAALIAPDAHVVSRAHNAHHVYEDYIAHAVPDAHVAHDTPSAHDISEDAAGGAPVKTQGRKGHKLPRINMAFSNEHLAYIHTMAGFERMSATQYVNNLIRADMNKRMALYAQLNAMRNEGTI